jgi:hypothetical protein
MRTIAKRTWVLQILALTVLCLGSSAWPQDTSGLKPSDGPQIAQPPDGSVNWKGVGLGAGAVVSNLVYVPAKLVYGILGGIAGGAGYALTGGNTQVANSIWRSSLGGDYVLTPDMMAGKKPIYFSGPSDSEPVQATSGIGALRSNGAVSTPGASLPVPSAGADTRATTQPIDNGAGPVSPAGVRAPAPYAGINNPGSGYPSSNPVPSVKGTGLPNTNVE